MPGGKFLMIQRSKSGNACVVAHFVSIILVSLHGHFSGVFYSPHFLVFHLAQWIAALYENISCDFHSSSGTLKDRDVHKKFPHQARSW